MNILCPNCHKSYDLNLNSANQASIICMVCNCHFDCEIVSATVPKYKFGFVKLGRIIGSILITRNRDLE